MRAVNTCVPDLNATDSTTATTVSNRRSACDMTPRSVTFSTTQPFRRPGSPWAHPRGSVAQLLHLVEHGSRRRLEHLVDDLAVGQEHDAIRVARGDRVVGDHHDRLVELIDGATH